MKCRDANWHKTLSCDPDKSDTTGLTGMEKKKCRREITWCDTVGAFSSPRKILVNFEKIEDCICVFPHKTQKSNIQKRFQKNSGRSQLKGQRS